MDISGLNASQSKKTFSPFLVDSALAGWDGLLAISSDEREIVAAAPDAEIQGISADANLKGFRRVALVSSPSGASLPPMVLVIDSSSSGADLAAVSGAVRDYFGAIARNDGAQVASCSAMSEPLASSLAGDWRMKSAADIALSAHTVIRERESDLDLPDWAHVFAEDIRLFVHAATGTSIPLSTIQREAKVGLYTEQLMEGALSSPMLFNWIPGKARDTKIEDLQVTCDSLGAGAQYLQPDQNLARWLELMNVSSNEWKAYLADRGEDVDGMVVNGHAWNDFRLDKRVANMPPAVPLNDVYEIIESSIGLGVPVLAISIPVSAILGVQDGKAMSLSGGQFGLHDFASGDGALRDVLKTPLNISFNREEWVLDGELGAGVKGYGFTDKATQGLLTPSLESDGKLVKQELEHEPSL